MPIRRLALALAVLAAGPALAQERARCPAELPANTTCHSGRDSNGAYYWMAVPEPWNGVLVVHAHGGPRTAPPEPDSPVEDLVRFSVMVREGYAWAGSAYRRAGYGVRLAAEDTENVRRLFVERIARPRRTILHGQSWGGNVAAKLVEIAPRGPDGRSPYDAALLTSGVLGGGTRGYDYRADLRAVYQYVCRNHPAPEDTAYPVWMGLVPQNSMTARELARRVGVCTGLGRPAAERTPEQRHNLADILAVTRIPERTLIGHMNWATFLFADMVQERLGGRNPFTNRNVRYQGSRDDAALNAGVERFDADPQAVAALADDSDLTGAIDIPVLTVHAIDDPTAFVEHESAYRDVVERAGRLGNLVQTFTDEHEHSKLATPEYAALLQALMAWVDRGQRPTPAAIAAACEPFRQRYAEPCLFRPEFRPQPYASRVAPRQ